MDAHTLHNSCPIPRGSDDMSEKSGSQQRRGLFLTDVCYIDPAYRNQFSIKALKTTTSSGSNSLRGTNTIAFNHLGNPHNISTSSSIDAGNLNGAYSSHVGKDSFAYDRPAPHPFVHPAAVSKDASIIFKKCSTESKHILTSILVSNREKAIVYHRALHAYQAYASAAAKSREGGVGEEGRKGGNGEGEVNKEQDDQWDNWLKPIAEPFIMKIQSDVSKVDVVSRKECKLRVGPRDPSSWLHFSFRDVMRSYDADLMPPQPWNGGDEVDERHRKVRARRTENKYLANWKVTSSWKGSWNHNLGGGCFKIKTRLLNMDRFCQSRARESHSGTLAPGESASSDNSAVSNSHDPGRKATSGGIYSNQVDEVFPAYIPIVVPLPKSRAWCSLRSNVASDDQLELRVNPYLGEDDGAYKELYFEGYDAIPDHFEGEIVEMPAVQTVKLLLLEYQSQMSPEKFRCLASALGEYSRREDADSEGAEHESASPEKAYRRMAQNIVTGLCKVLPVTENQIRRLSKRLCDESTTTPSMMRKAIFHFDRDANQHNLGDKCHKSPVHFYEDAPSARSALTSHPSRPSFVKRRPESSHLEDFGVFPLLANPNVYGMGHCVSQNSISSHDAENSGSRSSASNSSARVWSSFEDNLRQMSRDGNLDLSDVNHLNKAYNIVADSFRSLFCRRCFIFDCPVHRILLPMPRDRVDPPPPALCPIKGLELPSDLIRRPTLTARRKPSAQGVEHETVASSGISESESESSIDEPTSVANPFASVPFGLFDEERNHGAVSNVGSDLSFVEAALTFKLMEAFNFNPKSLSDVAHCLGTRDPSDISRFFKRYHPYVLEPPPKERTDSEDPSCSQLSLCKPCVTYKKETKYSLKRKVNKKSAINLPAPMYDYEPCDHPGACTTKNGCRCRALGVNCEKYCGCSIADCGLRLEGCKCRVSNTQGCCNSKVCPCFAAGRECDPELCRSCGSTIHPSFLENIKAYIANKPEDQKEQLCCNVGLRRGDRKRLGVARSDIQGWGLFILEKAAKNDLILEYTGEVISHNEAERRGVLYDRFGCSYLFNLNKESVVDSTRMGNIAKFVNHSDRNDRNCYPCIKIVDGTHRIGLYAKRPIEAGEELTFDYQYTKETAPAWAEPRAQKRSRSSRPPEKKARVMH